MTDFPINDEVTIAHLKRICRLIENKTHTCVCGKPVVNITTHSGHRLRFEVNGSLPHDVIIPAGEPLGLELKPGVFRTAHHKTCEGSEIWHRKNEADESEWLVRKLTRHPDFPDPTDVPEWDSAN